MTTDPEKITFGEMREFRLPRCADLLPRSPMQTIDCRDHRCSHHVETNADGWRDDVRLSRN